MKSIVTTLVCLITFAAAAQMSLKKLDGTPINDGDVMTFDVAEDPGSYLGIKIYNSSASDINIRVKCESITNSDGTNLQLCVGNVCLSTIFAGSSYPNFPAVIEANGENGNFDHFVNMNTGINPLAPVEYVFKFFQVDDNGVEIGNSVSFSYRYVSALGVSNFTQLDKAGLSLKSTIVSNEIEMVVSKDLQCILYDINGKTLARQNLGIGNHTLDVSNFNSGVYVLSFENNEGQKGSARIIKK